MVRPAGFEPATLGLEGPVSDRLSIDGYHPRRLDGLDLANSRRFLPHFAVSSPHVLRLVRTNVPEIMGDLHTITDLSDPDQIRRDIDACATRWQLDKPWITRTMHRTVRFWHLAPTMRASRQRVHTAHISLTCLEAMPDDD